MGGGYRTAERVAAAGSVVLRRLVGRLEVVPERRSGFGVEVPRDVGVVLEPRDRGGFGIGESGQDGVGESDGGGADGEGDGGDVGGLSGDDLVLALHRWSRGLGALEVGALVSDGSDRLRDGGVAEAGQGVGDGWTYGGVGGLPEPIKIG
ncbi:MAG: hypothetical protein CMJ31_03450 [Phycisphaerae bacterium]|nr:hypothetical protein [Phycisphaerae bacterium]